MSTGNIFSGAISLNNLQHPHRLEYRAEDHFCDLAIATNVVIVDDGSITRRNGKLVVTSSAAHSMWSYGKFCFYVSGGVLYRMLENGTSVIVHGAVGNNKMFYEYMFDRVYCSNGTVKLVILDMSMHSYDFVAPPKYNADTRQFGMPFSFTRLCRHAGRMLVVDENRLWISEPGMPEVFDIGAGPLSFDKIYDLKSVKSGIYISTASGVFFLDGSSKDDFKKSLAYHEPAISGTMVVFDGQNFLDGRIGGLSAMWVSKSGVCLGDQSGAVLEISHRKLRLESSVTGSAIVADGFYFFSLEV